VPFSTLPILTLLSFRSWGQVLKIFFIPFEGSDPYRHVVRLCFSSTGNTSYAKALKIWVNSLFNPVCDSQSYIPTPSLKRLNFFCLPPPPPAQIVSFPIEIIAAPPPPTPTVTRQMYYSATNISFTRPFPSSLV